MNACFRRVLTANIYELWFIGDGERCSEVGRGWAGRNKGHSLFIFECSSFAGAAAAAALLYSRLFCIVIDVLKIFIDPPP